MNIHDERPGVLPRRGQGFGSVVPATVELLAAGMPLGTTMGGCAVAFLAAVVLPGTIGIDLHRDE